MKDEKMEIVATSPIRYTSQSEGMELIGGKERTGAGMLAP
jgi:hypothetical protein